MMHTPNPFAAFRCRKAQTRGVITSSARCSMPASKQPDTHADGSIDNSNLHRASIPDPQPTKQEAAAERPSTARRATATQRRRPAAKRKAAGSVPADAAGLPQPAGVPELLGDAPLRLVLVGHNPSDHAWKSGHYYSNPSNWMWRLLKQTGIAPPQIRGAQDDRQMPVEAGVGFVDVGCGVPGTASNQFSSAVVSGWGTGFFLRLAKHTQRACDAIRCTCGVCGAPAVVAFTGKRQFSELVNHGKRGKAKITNIPLGLQTLRPEGWPLPLSTAVWVLTSTSGASPMTNADRAAPYQALADAIAGIPRERTAACQGVPAQATAQQVAACNTAAVGGVRTVRTDAGNAAGAGALAAGTTVASEAVVAEDSSADGPHQRRYV